MQEMAVIGVDGGMAQLGTRDARNVGYRVGIFEQLEVEG
jgi:hypothetical protein